MRGEDADVGARIVEVVAKSPAEEAGSEGGRHRRCRRMARPILSYRELQSAIDKHVIGDKVKLDVSRERKSVELEITLGKYPAPKESPSSWPSRCHRKSSSVRTVSTPAGLGGQNENLEQGPTAHEFGGIYQSQDGGVTWQRINSLNPRPMYYSQIRVDPTNSQHIWVLGTELYLSKDGGKTFESENTARDVHVDHHAMWIDPRDGRHVHPGQRRWDLCDVRSGCELGPSQSRGHRPVLSRGGGAAAQLLGLRWPAGQWQLGWPESQCRRRAAP